MMEREDHEALLTELLSGDIEQSRKTEILQELRVDYNNVHTDVSEMVKASDKLQKQNDDLVISNSQLFRQAGIFDNDKQKKEEVEEKEFSETVTLEAIEGGNA